MATQFIHIEGYALSGRRGKPSVKGVIAEAARDPVACAHIEDFLPATVIFGCAPSEAERVLRERVGHGRGRSGRGVPVTALVLLTAVASWPQTVDEVLASASDSARYEDWRRRTVEFFRHLWGSGLLSVVEHSDEVYPHLHLLAVPPLDSQGILSIETISGPHRAQAEMRRQGGSRADQRREFRNAAASLQDSYHSAVGALCGLDRLSERRQRLSRSEALARRSAREADRRAEEAREAAWKQRELELRTELDAYRAKCAVLAAEEINADRRKWGALRKAAAAQIRRGLEEKAYLLAELERLGWEPPKAQMLAND